MNRIQRLQEKLTTDVLIVDFPSDLLYLTGIDVTPARLILSRDKAALFVTARDFDQAKSRAPCPVFSTEKWVEFVQSAQTIGFDSACVTVEAFQKLQQTFPGKEWTPIPRPLQVIRSCKEREEIEALRKAAKLTWEGFQHISKLLKEGIAEEELAFEFEIFCRKKGATRLSFPPNIGFGPNSAFPHHRAGKTRLNKDQIILFDLGAVVDEYAGDMTRVLFFGHPDPQLERDYKLVREVQRLAVKAIRPGIRFGELDKLVRERMKEEGVADLFIHGLSHGIGLNVHEYPTMRVSGDGADILLEVGMVITVEPGLYRPGTGGVRYEDTVLITESGVENFYPDG